MRKNIFFWLFFLLFYSFAQAADLSGEYSILHGANPGGGNYNGSVEIKKNQDIYKLAWKISSSPAYEGVGIVVDGILCAGWGVVGNYGVVVYKVSGRMLKGVWAVPSLSRIGNEDLEGPEGLSGVYQITNSSSAGTGKNYRGTVAINKNGEVYLLTWTLERESYSGIGILEGNLLIVGWGVGNSFGVVYYRQEKDLLSGRWAIPANSGIGIEIITRK